MNNGCFVTDEELSELKKMNISQRLLFIRKQLNELFPSEFTKKQVVDNSGVISYQGLHYLESKQPEHPKAHTVKGLAAFYGVPYEIFTDEYYETNPKQFFLGKKETNFSETKIFDADYEVELSISVRRHGQELIEFPDFVIPEKLSVNANYMDLFALIEALNNNLEIIKKKNVLSKRGIEAVKRLTSAVEITKPNKGDD